MREDGVPSEEHSRLRETKYAFPVQKKKCKSVLL